MFLFSKDTFKFLKSKKTSGLTEKSCPSVNTSNKGLRCDRCRCILRQDNIVLEYKAHLCTECSEKIQLLKKQLSGIDEIITGVIAKSGIEVSDEGVGRIKDSVMKFLERYIADKTVVYQIYDFSTSDNFISLKFFEKDNDCNSWCVYCRNNTKEPEKTKIHYPEINDENIAHKLAEILLLEESIAGKSALIRYEEERTDKDGRIYLGSSSGDWEFSEYYYDKKNKEFIEEKYHHEYLDTGTVFDSYRVVTANKIYGVFSESKDADLIKMLSGYCEEL